MRRVSVVRRCHTLPGPPSFAAVEELVLNFFATVEQLSEEILSAAEQEESVSVVALPAHPPEEGHDELPQVASEGESVDEEAEALEGAAQCPICMEEGGVHPLLPCSAGCSASFHLACLRDCCDAAIRPFCFRCRSSNFGGHTDQYHRDRLDLGRTGMNPAYPEDYHAFHADCSHYTEARGFRYVCPCCRQYLSQEQILETGALVLPLQAGDLQGELALGRQMAVGNGFEFPGSVENDMLVLPNGRAVLVWVFVESASAGSAGRVGPSDVFRLVRAPSRRALHAALGESVRNEE